jgi:hypothetical protein
MVVFALSSVGWIILLVCAALLGVILIKLAGTGKKGGKGPPPLPQKDLANLTIKEAMVGDIVSLTGFGDAYDDVDFVIEKRNRYAQGRYEWYELLGVYMGKQVWIEWEEDDALYVTATSPERELRLAVLNLTEEELARMDEEESSDNFIEHEGRKFYYDESSETFFFKDCSGSGEGFYLWDFESEDGEEIISVEKWEGEPFSVFSGKVIKPYNIRVFKR